MQGSQAAHELGRLFGRLQPLQYLAGDALAQHVVPVVAARLQVGGGLADVVQQGGKPYAAVGIFAGAEAVFQHVVVVEVAALGKPLARRKLGQNIVQNFRHL